MRRRPPGGTTTDGSGPRGSTRRGRRQDDGRRAVQAAFDDAAGHRQRQEVVPGLPGGDPAADLGRRLRMQRLAQALRRFEIGGFLPFTEKFARRDLLAGRPLRTLGAAPLQGTGAGVDAQGVLKLRGADGQLHAVSSGEVSVRPC